MAIRATLLALLFACQSAPAAPPDAPKAKETVSPTSQSAEGAAPCVDKELAKRGLDQYGGDQGTMYPGGTPLFQESTGKRTDRTQYVYAHHPDIAAACGGADAGH
jgi:hypothetical protein